MCSVQEEDLGAPVARVKLTSDEKRKVCMKCGEQAAIVVIRVGDPFCKECFMQYAVHKFRSAFGKNKVVGFKEKVLVAFSGGASSIAMLHLVTEGNSERAHKKLGFDPGLVFIDEGVVSGQTPSERESFVDEVVSTMKKSEYPCHYTRLEQALHVNKSTSIRPNSNANSAGDLRPVDKNVASDSNALHPDSSSLSNSSSSQAAEAPVDDLKISTMKLSEDAEKEFLEQLNSLKSLTAKENFLHLLRQQLLVDIARKNGYTKIMLGDCATRLAADIIANIAQGRGAHVALDTGFLDSRLSDVMFIRPMRDFTTKEIAIYNRLNDIQPVVAPTLSTKMPMNASINRLTENFVNGLQNDFPATVSTIFRTGSKMQVAKSSESNKAVDDQTASVKRVPEYAEDCCPLCMAPLDTKVTESSALYATQFSASLSRQPGGGQDSKMNSCGSNLECCGQGDGSCNSSIDTKLTTAQITSFLCYGCQLLVRDMRDPVKHLPNFVLENVAWRSRRSTMREQISDFLLQEDE